MLVVLSMHVGERGVLVVLTVHVLQENAELLAENACTVAEKHSLELQVHTAQCISILSTHQRSVTHSENCKETTDSVSLERSQPIDYPLYRALKLAACSSWNIRHR